MQITVENLTIRQLKTLGKAVEVKGFSKMNTASLIEAIRLNVGDEAALQKHVDAMLTTEEKRNLANKANGQPAEPSKSKLTDEEKEQVRLDTLMAIAKAAGRRMKAEDALRSRRQELNQEVSEAKAGHSGAMERGVDYEDAASVRSKLEDVTDAWQSWQDHLEHRRLELEPLKKRLSETRTEERKAFETSKQLKIRF